MDTWTREEATEHLRAVCASTKNEYGTIRTLLFELSDEVSRMRWRVEEIPTRAEINAIIKEYDQLHNR